MPGQGEGCPEPPIVCPLFQLVFSVFFGFAFAFSEKHGILYVFHVSHGLVAQSVEHRPFKAVVQGSSPCQLTFLFFNGFRNSFRKPFPYVPFCRKGASMTSARTVCIRAEPYTA